MSHAKFQVLTMLLDLRGSRGKGWNFVWGNNEFWLNWRFFCMTPHFLFIIFWGYFCYHSSQSLFQVGKNIFMLYDNCRKDAGNCRKWKKWCKNSPPTRSCLETTKVLETWYDSFVFNTSECTLRVLIPTWIRRKNFTP